MRHNIASRYWTRVLTSAYTVRVGSDTRPDLSEIEHNAGLNARSSGSYRGSLEERPNGVSGSASRHDVDLRTWGSLRERPITLSPTTPMVNFFLYAIPRQLKRN